jgi:hypothetical protein
MDITAAKDTMARIRVLEKEMGVHLAFAHDISWVEAGTDDVLLSLLDDDLRKWVDDGVKQGRL